jgi:hypothetical protein
MTQVMFIRTTHEDGRWRLFPPEAWQFWHEHGAVVGEVLRVETPLAFAEVVTASREYALEYPESGLYLVLDEAHIAWCLIKLIAYGMVSVVVDAWPQPDHQNKLNNNEEVPMNQVTATFVTLFTNRHLAQVVLPALPVAGDAVFIGRQGYEVVFCEWVIQENNEVQISIVVQPQIGEDGQRPLNYAEEET